MKILEMLYEGKAKKVFKTDDDGKYVVFYKDDATAFNGLKKGTILSKGIVNNKVSAFLFKLLEENGIPTHFIELLSDREMLVKKVEIIPVEVLVRNYSAGSISKRLGLSEGIKFKQPVIEFCYKNDALSDPMVNEDHITKVLEVSTEKELKEIKEMSLKINQVLSSYLLERGLILVDFKLEFGRTNEGIILADEISPDTCRLWDSETKEKLDKDRFRRDLGNVEEAYLEVLKRITGGDL